jgi:hypothetical protein
MDDYYEDNPFVVEGRYFPNSLQAFTFAQIQADRMKRVVEVRHTTVPAWAPMWYATAAPTGYRRRHLVMES